MKMRWLTILVTLLLSVSASLHASCIVSIKETEELSDKYKDSIKINTVEQMGEKDVFISFPRKLTVKGQNFSSITLIKMDLDKVIYAIPLQSKKEGDLQSVWYVIDSDLSIDSLIEISFTNSGSCGFVIRYNI